ncbi:GIY-YIG nuclease family protein [Phenylobacterium immobile]|uniref:GIY-YIG nuclease family protein n=1 Tax=Phenylobacterium immobile TaxID=21 RepID=UPI000AB88696|nr:GIY-YIG nuclease family protein [Phenylobacterium immobile]
MERSFYVYILASQRNGTLYTGVTGDLSRRVWTHQQREGDGFAARHGVTRLVWYEEFPTADEAITAEKRIKRWRRAWKIRRIEEANPLWLDLYETFNS